MTATRTPDYYQLLGIPPDATTEQIKKAYRKLARQHHPDSNPGDPDAAARFREITDAYDTLTDPARRTAYDRQHGPFTRTTPADNDTTGPDGSTDPDLIQDAPEAISRVLAILEDIWRAIRARHPVIPAAVLIVGSGTSGKQAKWGHYAPERWTLTETGTLPEILISGEGLRRTPREILATLLHEAAHALAAATGVKDTSRQGRYHNKHYQALAAHLGLHTSHHPSTGWSLTTVPDTTAIVYGRYLTRLADALTIWRNGEYQQPATTRRNTNLIAAACPCGRRIRIAATTLAEAPITCQACNGDFETQDA